MNFGAIISNSFKYPFKDLKSLGFVCLLFALLLVLPAGIIFENSIVAYAGAACILIFILIVPGYKILVIKSGINQSGKSSIKPGRSIINTFKLLVLYICYIAIPSIIACLIMLFATGMWDYPMAILNSTSDLNVTFDMVSGFLNAILITFIITAIVRLIFTLLSYIAQARLADSNSLVEALKIHKVIRDIRKIGLLKFIGWYVVIGILLAIISMITIYIAFYVHPVVFIIYLCFVMPLSYLIYNYSLGLLYSDFGSGKNDDDDDLDKFERELRYLKYGIIH